jgi:tetratricopeptide (TPR) repeat protein
LKAFGNILFWFRRPSRKAAAVLVLGAVLGVAFARSFEANAQNPSNASGTWNATEAEALSLYEQEQMVSARTKAEEALAQNPDSLVGHYVLGCVLQEAEGSLARAMFHLGRARELYETTWAASARPAGAPWELHREILFKVQSLAGQMELFEYQLQVLGYHDYLYDPDLLAEHAWPLMALGRYDEAREFAQKASEVRNDPYQHSAGLNALCAIEGEAGTRQPYLDACLAALENAKQRAARGDEQGSIAVHAYNASMAARSTLDFTREEALALEGVSRLELTPANPWRQLARMYVDQGKLTEAVEALREMQRWKRRQPAYLREQAHAETDVAFATVLLIAGRTEIGLPAVDRAIDQPDRRGLTTSRPEQALGAHSLLRRALRITDDERAYELAGARGFFGGFGDRMAVSGHTSQIWADEERIRSVLSNDERITRTFRIYVKGGIEPIPVWLLGDLVEVLGAGVVSVALRRARVDEGEDTRMAPYYQALEAEIALEQGDEGRAQNLAAAALESLPPAEALLRARVAAIAAVAATERDQHATALGFYEQALGLDGGVFRRMRLSIPAEVRANGGGLAEEVADMLEGSPRFRDDRGFTVLVSAIENGAVEACLLNPSGARVGCSSVDPHALEQQFLEAVQEYDQTLAQRREEGAETDDVEAPEPIDPAEKLVRDFHDRIFSAPVTLSSHDLTSLDGRTTTGGEVARERMENLLDQAIAPAP